MAFTYTRGDPCKRHPARKGEIASKNYSNLSRSDWLVTTTLFCDTSVVFDRNTNSGITKSPSFPYAPLPAHEEGIRETATARQLTPPCPHTFWRATSPYFILANHNTCGVTLPLLDPLPPDPALGPTIGRIWIPGASSGAAPEHSPTNLAMSPLQLSSPRIRE